MISGLRKCGFCDFFGPSTTAERNGYHNLISQTNKPTMIKIDDSEIVCEGRMAKSAFFLNWGVVWKSERTSNLVRAKRASTNVIYSKSLLAVYQNDLVIH